MKRRVIKEGDVFKIEYKHWFWGWVRLTYPRGSIDGSYWEEDIMFTSLEEAEKSIKSPIVIVIKEFR